MRYVFALAVATLLSLTVFGLPWIVTRVVPPPESTEDEVELSPHAELLVAVADLVYSCRWVLAVIIFVGCVMIARLWERATQP
jgi:hypothetical protein